ncbi:beta-1,4 N-acetylgalactosaminyltransferase 1-like [Branchiostoma floridae x Branchiostoma belcheri]
MRPYVCYPASLPSLSRLRQKHTCDCSKSMSSMYTAIEDEERSAFNQRRVKELEKYNKRLESSQEKLYIVKGSVPLSYPVRGLTVAPEGTIAVPVNFRYLTYEASIPVRIQPPSVPNLYDPGPDEDIASKVTVITKTFLRYASIRALLASIRAFYPNIRVIVADDSRPIENLQAEHVDHFVMPYAIGWFAGRNLAVSQVTTPYLVWVDDDFVFGKRTKLERLASVLDNTTLDLVSGKAGFGKVKYTKMTAVPGDRDGDCLLIHDRRHWGQFPGFPQCYFSTRVTNFFMARTDRVRAVGFDPKYTRHGHTQFFVAAMGKLKMAACDDVRIGHRRTQTMEYNAFRYQGEDYQQTQWKYEYFKFNIKCHLWFTDSENCTTNSYYKCNPVDGGFYLSSVERSDSTVNVGEG